MPTHSAYRSGLLVQRYKAAYIKKHGKGKSPYSGKKPTKTGLARWFDEDWRTQEGSKVYQRKGDIFRPTKRITEDTPITLPELTVPQIRRARKEKRRTGRVKRFGY
jgi:hypothetical protein